MIYPLIIILILLVIIFFNHLNRKIQKLEKEISELNRKLENEQHIEIREENIVPPVTFATEKEQSVLPPEESKAPERIPDTAGNDRLSPVFDFLKQNALTIIGIFTLVLGIGYFVKYAIDRDWIGETSRVGIGLLIGAGIMVTGHFLRKNYTVFSSIITGGGIAVLYFTTTIAFREYHLFSQTVAFSVTCLITLISIALAYYYKSETLIIFSLFGGFLAPLMISTGQSNYPFLLTYLTVLNIGMLAIVFLKNWKSVGWVAFIFTNIYLFYWTVEKTEILTVYFFIVTYIIFYAFALQNYFKKGILASFDILMLILINFTSIIGLVYIFNELKYEAVIIFPVGFAIVNSFLLYREYSRKNFEVNYSVFAGIIMSLITIAFALQLKTHLITSVWAVEATLLLFIWKKTNLNIFKIGFYILFPLVIIAQIITWSEYIDAVNLGVVFNPVFLTSSVTVVTTFVNLILLKKLPDTDKENTSFFENVFAIASYGVIYVALLLEIIYHISAKPWVIIFSISLIYSLFYIFIILLFRKKLEINKILETGLIYLFLFLIIINAVVSGSGIVTNFLLKKVQLTFYFMHLSYWIPFVYILFKILPKSHFLTLKFSYWLVSLAVITAVSSEFYHLYLLINAEGVWEVPQLEKHFRILYLPIIWAVLASILIYKGMKSGNTEYPKIGFVLIGIMILKLYTYDVWEMDNVSRIIAFIILGIILLLSSFLFQRLKNIIKNMVENKDENPESEKIKS
ncbi:beta-carotene 15,15'-monooxygenase [Chryseobacterium sp. IHB B 17019]|uniref:DUF2339 domain-containing protein n=1 Tax=Chryseobacterium sp. IHB B 17019 TaxID=1721091 RepID=UPI0007221B4B|nr:DUF2339 domain-containing protein [Chryseobacterium sp. IHB B 17019]ALR29924.1 beta-carotene 15,15'-monooxygenase [Chryseobacterium sp. IHB B 17019]